MKLISLTELANQIPDGAKLVVPKDSSGVSVAATFALIARGIKNLHVVCLPVSGLQTDMLIGAGCVDTLETSAVTLGEYGAAPRFTDAAKTGSLKLIDGTCPAIYAGMQASQKGIPFIPLRGILDSDLLSHRTDWKVIDNPFESDDPIVAIKAINPEVGLFHGQTVDQFGNVFIGRDRDALLLAHAAKQTFCTVEHTVPGNLLDDPDKSGAVIPAMYLTGVAHVAQAAWPIGYGDTYLGDDHWLRQYAAAARDASSFTQWLQDARAASPWADQIPAMPALAQA
jgi:glutaconate CoA-transferase subunit A